MSEVWDGISSSLSDVYFQTQMGYACLADARKGMRALPSGSLNLILTSPPFALRRKKEYGNVDAEQYVDWFAEFAREFHRLLRDDGSLVIDLGGSWNPGLPTRSLYHLDLVVTLCRQLKFHLAEEFFWYNPSKLPTPAEWVTVRRMRVKDAVNTVWWLSKTPWPKADNRKVLRPYSSSMRDLLKNGYEAKLRPSGHNISSKFGRDNGGAIPPNLLELANTDSNGAYLARCREHGLKPHPARFQPGLPEFFVKFLTEEGDVVMDPFLGSAVTGEVCEKLGRNWLGFEVVPEYLEGAMFRFSPCEAKITEDSTEAPLPPRQVVLQPDQLRLLDRTEEIYRAAEDIELDETP
jgi:site-specific DNA-methyltransferase (cytosine-N4-specific)